MSLIVPNRIAVRFCTTLPFSMYGMLSDLLFNYQLVRAARMSASAQLQIEVKNVF